MMKQDSSRSLRVVMGLVIILLLGCFKTAHALDAVISWARNPEADNVTEYRIYYDTARFDNNKPNNMESVNSDYWNQDLNDQFQNVVDPIDNIIYKITMQDLNPGQGYYVGITAVSDDMESLVSELVNTITDNPNDIGIPHKAALSPAGITSNSVTLNWNKPADDLGVTRFLLTRNGRDLKTINATSNQNYAYTDSTVAAETQYSYGVRSYDAAGHYSESNIVKITTLSGTNTDKTPPSTPGSVRLATGGAMARSITVQWDAAQDNIGGTGVARYLVYKDSNMLDQVIEDKLGSPSYSYIFTGLTADTTYEFQVSAVDNAGNESSLAPYGGLEVTSAREVQYDNTPPDAPDVTTIGLTSTGVTMQWDTCQDNNGGSGLLKYEIYRNNQTIKIGETTDTQLPIKKLNSNTTYTFQVCAVDKSGNRAFSADVHVRTKSSGNSNGGGDNSDGGSCFINSSMSGLFKSHRKK